MDCRRPVHLANIYAEENVIVFWDSTQGNDDLPSDGDNLSGDEDTSDSDDDEEEDDDDDDDSNAESKEKHHSDDDEEEATFEDVEGSGPEIAQNEEFLDGGDSHQNKRDVNYDGGDEKDDHKEEEVNDEDSPHLRSSKRQKTGDRDGFDDKSDTGEEPFEEETPITDQDETDAIVAADLNPREMHQLRRNRLRSYYRSGSFYGSPSAFVAYSLASQLRYGEKSDLLWLACVGVTDAYLHARLDKCGWAKIAHSLTDSCKKLFPNTMLDRAINTVYAEDLIHGTCSDQRKTKITLSENGRIVSEKDFRFFLLRHTSLLDAMLYSEYVYTKLQINTKKGEQKFMEMLAKMGYPLDECRQPYAFMKPNLRRRLKEKLTAYSQVRQQTLGAYPLLTFTYC
jgi:cell division control protein 45